MEMTIGEMEKPIDRGDGLPPFTHMAKVVDPADNATALVPLTAETFALADGEKRPAILEAARDAMERLRRAA